MLGRNMNWANVVVGCTAGQGISYAFDRCFTSSDRALHPFGFRNETVWAGFSENVARIGLIGGGEWLQAIEALRVLGLSQTRINTDALIEHEAFARVMLAATIF